MDPNATSAASPSDEVVAAARRVLGAFPDLGVALLFGSLARGRAGPRSDVDVAVAASRPLASEDRLDIAAKLSLALHRDADVIDLQRATGTILEQALTTGRILFIRDKPLYAELLKKLWYDQADMMPLYRRILAARRERFLHG